MKVPFLSFYVLLISLARSAAVNNLLRVSIERISGLMAMPDHLRPMGSSFWPFHDLDVLLRSAEVSRWRW
jgi:hypothetical protein